MSRRGTAVFGSAFDPPHLGHADVVRQLLPEHRRVLMVPAAAHAFGKQMLPFAQRLEMVQALIGEQFGKDPRIHACTIEVELLARSPDQPVYSIDLMLALQSRDPDEPLALVLGPDNARPETFSRFHRWQELRAWPLAVVRERLPVHSSQVRALLACDPPPSPEALARLTGTAVAERLLAQNLYRASADR